MIKPVYFSYTLQFSLLIVFVTLFSEVTTALAQVVPDNTLGAENSAVNPRDANSESIDGGAIRGQNLFHSFEEFNVGEDSGVYFANPDAVTDIFSRVTGNNVSNILGTLGVDGAANLYLINPNGIVFGEGASLDVQGSFAATTADGIEFGEQGFFSAINPTESVLTISVPLGLQFGSTPGNIINRSFVEDSTEEFVGLQVPNGENLTLVGGDVSFEAGEVTARGGNIEIGGLSAVGTVTFKNDGSLTFPEDVAKADISLSNDADVDVRGTSGGSVNINANNLTLETGEFGGSSIRAGITADSTSTEAQAGDITINATDNVKVDESFVFNEVSPEAQGNAGNVTIFTNNLNLINGARVDTSTLGLGNAGSVKINAMGDITADGFSSDGFSSGAASSVRESAVGDGGDISITTNNLTLTNGARIDTSTFGTGNAGSVKINAMGDITADGFSPVSLSSGAASSVETGAVGNAGNVTIFTNDLTLTNGARVDTSTFSQGNAGSVNIKAMGDITADGFSSAGFSSGAASSVGEFAVGNGGTLNIATNNLTLTNGARVDTSTFGTGNAGSVKIKAIGDITADGFSSAGFSSGAASSVGEFAMGDGGTLNITTDNLTLTNGARVDTSTLGLGIAGDLKIVVNFLSLNNNASISSTSSGESISDAGDITLNIVNSLQARDSSINATSDLSSGGEIKVAAKDIYLRGNSDILTNIDTRGGSITLTAETIITFDDSDIFAVTRDGQEGNIFLNTNVFFAENFTLNSLNTKNMEMLENNNRADVNATGNVSIPDVSFIQNSLTELSNDSLDTDELVANSCVVPVGDRSQGKFIITGTESLPLSPGDGIPSKYPTGKVRNVPEQSSWQSGDPIIEPQGAYRLANGKLVLSRECW